MKTLIFICLLAWGSPLLSQQNPYCREIALDELLGRIEMSSDTIYVVNFWATWCKPCIEELPSFDALEKSTRNQPVKIIMVSLDDPKVLQTKVQPFVKKLGYSMEFVLLNESKPNEWINRIDSTWSGAIPATLLFDGRLGRKEFHENDFTKDDLQKTVSNFRMLNND